MSRPQDRYRLLRTKTALTDDGPWGGLDQPSSTDWIEASSTPMRAAYVFLVPANSSNVALDDDNAGTCSLRTIKLADLDADDAIDAADLVLRSDALTSVPYYSEVQIPALQGALRWTVELSSLANSATGQARVRVYYRVVTDDAPA